jgi:hypothetical protein
VAGRGSLESADLLELLGLLGLGLGSVGLGPAGEDLLGAHEQLLLPGVAQGRVDAIAAERTRLRADGDRRKLRVAELEDRLCDLCVPCERETTPEMKPHERDFANLINESIARVRCPSIPDQAHSVRQFRNCEFRKKLRKYNLTVGRTLVRIPRVLGLTC